MKQIKLTTEKMLLETNGPVSWITFNQPEKRNAISLAMWEGLAEALALSMEDESIKVVVLKGAGGQAFVSGADTIVDETGEHFFEIRVRTEKNFLGTELAPLPIMTGMIASVDIITGEKTVLDYLLKPVKRATANAMRER